ncbi:MAG: 2-O-(6-phospho-alpha-D-mannosyl)-D-glycerate hydrolase [Candidatus Sumerlaeota bacterium]|nr:2-O-(6-phospho-alpha-D-mannosyl)-D-glycerate hydrolase [Candidatus Sumerlaeota bacterium]
MTRYDCHVISNTHWDREWRYPFQAYRTDLVDLLDRLLDLLERRPDYRAFFLDSQTVILEDYLEIRPENEERIRALVLADRLQIGPWYTLPDEWGCPGEALVRNLLLGHRQARAFGRVAKVGYTPFSNGQISQLPQLYMGFGIDSCFFYRGVGKHVAKPEFVWEGADDTRVFAFKFGDYARYNYYYLAYRPGLLGRTIKDRDYTWDPDEVPYHVANSTVSLDRQYGWLEQKLFVREDKIAEALADTRKFTADDAQTSQLLYMMGHDHSAAAEEELDLVEALDKAARPSGDRILHSALTDYMEAFRKEARDLAVLKGEMRHVNKEGLWTNLMGHILSCRLYLKQRNAKVCADILHGAEPLAAMAWMTGWEWPAGFLNVAWKKILINHAHDAIGGCSTDRVHEEMLARWGEVETLGEELCRRAMRDMVKRIDGSALRREDLQLTVFNTLPFERRELADLWIDLPHQEAGTPFRLETSGGAEVAYQVLDTGSYKASIEGQLELTMPFRVQRARALVEVPAAPACGYEVLTVRIGEKPAAIANGIVASPNALENEHLRVTFNGNGTFDLTDKASGRTMKGLGLLEDTAEFGDPWNREVPARAKPILSRGCKATITVLRDGPLVGTLRATYSFSVPKGRDGDKRSSKRVALPVTVDVSLRRGERFLGVEAELDNRATDHRLRMLFPTGIAKATEATADSQFDVVQRPIELPNAKGWREAPYPTQPMWNWVDISDGEQGAAIINNGLIEYEAVDDAERTVAITLLRGFGKFVFSRPTPGSQCLGTRRYAFWIHPHAGDWRESDVVRLAQRHVVLLQGVLSAPGKGTRPRRASFLSVTDDRLIVSAIKQSEDGKSVVVRLWNPRAETISTRVDFEAPVAKATLLTLEELVQEELAPAGNSLTLAVGPKKIVTLAVSLAGM